MTRLDVWQLDSIHNACWYGTTHRNLGVPEVSHLLCLMPAWQWRTRLSWVKLSILSLHDDSLRDEEVGVAMRACVVDEPMELTQWGIDWSGISWRAGLRRLVLHFQCRLLVAALGCCSWITYPKLLILVPPSVTVVGCCASSGRLVLLNVSLSTADVYQWQARAGRQWWGGCQFEVLSGRQASSSPNALVGMLVGLLSFPSRTLQKRDVGGAGQSSRLIWISWEEPTPSDRGWWGWTSASGLEKVKEKLSPTSASSAGGMFGGKGEALPPRKRAGCIKPTHFE